MKRPIATLTGTGIGLPAAIMRNDDFVRLGLDTSDEWITSRTGIRERRIASADETTCTLAARASREALTRAGLEAGDIDTIVLSTATTDRLLPATAVDLQAELGASAAAAFDVAAACAGFIYAATVAEGLIASGASQKVLVVGAEKMSSIIDWQDRATCVLFGDGAGAAIMQAATDGRGILSSYIKSDGTLADLLYRPAGGAKIPMSQAVLDDRSHLVKMAGREVFRHAVRSMTEATDYALERAGLTGADIDLLIPHQANMRIIEATAKHANIPMDKVYVNVERFGNTSSASVPIAMHEALDHGRIEPGMTVLLAAFGAGFTWAAMVIRF